jgi:hypothetical protein
MYTQLCINTNHGMSFTIQGGFDYQMWFWILISKTNFCNVTLNCLRKSYISSMGPLSNAYMHKVVQGRLCGSNIHSVCAGLTSCSYFYCPTKTQDLPKAQRKLNKSYHHLLIGFLGFWCIGWIALWQTWKSSQTNKRHHKHVGPAIRQDVVQSTYCVHTLHTKKISSNLNSLNGFTKETGSSNVKLVLIR